MTVSGRSARHGLVALAAAGLLAGCTGLAGTLPAPADAAPVSRAPAAASTPLSAPVTSALALARVALPTGAPTPVREPRITGALNFRDVAGWKTSLPVAGGSTMARGVVYRSGRLKDLTRRDRRELAAAGVVHIVDLRTTQVTRRSPDPAIKGARYHHINLFGVYATRSVSYRSAAQAIAGRKAMNRRFVSDPVQRRQTAAVLKVIARSSGPVLIHCTEGKDRTGWIAAVLQLTAGASVRDVTADYLVSNELRKDTIDARYANVRKARGRKAADIERHLWLVDGAYLQAGLNELEKRYDDIDTYLSEGLRLSDTTVARLRARLRGE